MSGESINKSQEGYARATGWEDLADFSGERNINDATGKERTFSEFDIYPRMQGESSEEYGARLRKMHEMTNAYLEEKSNKEAKENAILNEDNIRTENYENSEFGQKELSAEAEYDALEAKLNQEVAEGKITNEEANKMLEEKMEAAYGVIEDARQDYTDRQTVGTEEEQQRYQDHWDNLAAAAEPEAPAAEEVAVEEEPAVETEPEPVIELSEEAQKRKMDDYLNIDDMLRSGRIDEEKAAHFREEVEEKYRKEAEAAAAAAEPEAVVEPEVVAEPEPAAEPEAENKNPLEGLHISTGANPNDYGRAEGEETKDLEKEKQDNIADYIHLVSENYKQIGGALGEKILLGNGTEEFADIQYSIWWDGLDKKSKEIVRGIFDAREEMADAWQDRGEEFPLGKKFSTWLFSNFWDAEEISNWNARQEQQKEAEITEFQTNQEKKTAA